MYGSSSQTVRRDVLLRRFNYPRASKDNLVLRQQLSILFRQKNFERRLAIYFLLTCTFNCIFTKYRSYTVVIID